ncbi:hypothetical protein [Desulfobacter curvatus]|uniref:hypothetical protein n=1 Tax=Desulfobacter curvatus TaxID=2290 RepID=UPI000527DEB0|nr:hypothetical protein [Desulfobacter curvatus]
MKKYIGWIIVGTLVLYLMSIPAPCILALPTLLGWLVPVLMWSTLGKGARNQALLLLITGGLLVIFAAYRGIFLGWQKIFTANLPLLAMFVAVSFLALTNTGIEGQALPQGKRALTITAFGTHLLGAVINLSVLFVFGDRLRKNGILTKTQALVLARSFCSAAWWSPFFVATGVALTYAPGMSWHETLIPGAMMSLFAIGYSIVEVSFFKKDLFSGYPFRTETMIVPTFLAAVVLGVHYLQPDISILTIICLVAPLGALVFMKFRPRPAALRDFINTNLSSVGSQFTLFLAAGVFSAGIKSMTQVYPALFSLGGATLTPGLLSVILAVMIIIGIAGVHPVVSISIASPLLLPLNPNPSQLGFVFLSCWAISTASSPLSGVGLALVSRYQVSPKVIIQSNWLYATVMWATAATVGNLFFVH